MKLGRNDRCSCGSGKKFKNCCEEKSNSLELGNLVTDFLYNYYIIYDSNKSREVSSFLHDFNPVMGDLVDALWYCLQLPRHGFDLIMAPDKLFSVGDGIQQHNIFIITNEKTQGNLNLLSTFPPTVYLTEETCRKEALELNDLVPAKLGIETLEKLDSDNLKKMWHDLREDVEDFCKKFKIKRDTLKGMSVQLINKEQRSVLPNIYLHNQYGEDDLNSLLEKFKQNSYSAIERALHAKEALFIANAYSQLGDTLNKFEKDFETIKQNNYKTQPTALILTLPGRPKINLTNKPEYKTFYNSTKEKEIIDFLAVQRAISLGGVWLEGELIPSQLFLEIAKLEKHFHEKNINMNYVKRTQRKIGKELVKCFPNYELGQFIMASSKLIAFTDFPIGLAILPGYDDPICNLIPITYRPLTPLDSILGSNLPQIKEHYIGRGKGFKVLIVECLDKKDTIRLISDIAWLVVKQQLNNNKWINVYYEEAESIDVLESIINKYRDIDFLIVSAHGKYNEHGEAGLEVGEEYWIPKDNLKVPPIVILSACHVAVKGTGKATISDRFLQVGALAVLGTLIPVNVKENAMLTQRFFYYISEVIDGHHLCYDLSEAWMRIINANVFSEILTSTNKLEKWFITKNKDGKTPYEQYFEKVTESGINRNEIHNKTIEYLLEIAEKDGMKKYLQSVLSSKGYIPESLFYIFSGYPEKVILKSRY